MAKRKKRRGSGPKKQAEAAEEIASEEDEGLEEGAEGEAAAPEERAAGSRPLAPGVPDPDGDNVSTGGGLVMMGIVFSLIALAVVAQYFME
ncbi:MAG: hypothetical protein RLO52_23005 [Sandaracinaceae bacterium]